MKVKTDFAEGVNAPGQLELALQYSSKSRTKLYGKSQKLFTTDRYQLRSIHEV